VAKIFFILVLLPLGWVAVHGQNITELEINEGELRSEIDDFFFFFVGKVEKTMDSIKHDSHDRRIGQSAMVFKTYSIAEAQRSVFVQDPLVGLIDVAALVFQMEDYYGGEDGERLFGEYAPGVVSLIKDLKRVLINLFGSLNPNWSPDVAMERLSAYADENPLLNDFFVRRSVRPFFESLKQHQKIKLKELAENMAASVDDMSQRLNYYMGLMPKQMRWQMELVAYNMTLDPAWSIKIDSLADSLGLNDWIDAYMIQVFDRVSLERELVFKDVDGLQESTFTAMDYRIDSMKTWIESYGLEVADLVDARIDSSMRKFDKLAANQIDSTLSQSEEMVNRILTKVFIGVLIIILFYGLVRRFLVPSK